MLKMEGTEDTPPVAWWEYLQEGTEGEVEREVEGVGRVSGRGLWGAWCKPAGAG